MAAGAFTRFDVHERLGSLGELSDAELGAWFRLVADLWENGPKPTGLLDGKPTGFLEPVNGGYSMEWLEVERARVEMRKRTAIANGLKSRGRPPKRKRTQRVTEITQPVNLPETQSVIASNSMGETQPVISKVENVESAVIEREKVSELIPPRAPAKRRAKIVRTLFEESQVNTFELFAFAFAGDPLADTIDLEYYFRAVARWSKSKGERRADWIETAKGFMERDKEAGKLRTKDASEQNSNELEEYLRT